MDKRIKRTDPIPESTPLDRPLPNFSDLSAEVLAEMLKHAQKETQFGGYMRSVRQFPDSDLGLEIAVSESATDQKMTLRIADFNDLKEQVGVTEKAFLLIEFPMSHSAYRTIDSTIGPSAEVLKEPKTESSGKWLNSLKTDLVDLDRIHKNQLFFKHAIAEIALKTTGADNRRLHSRMDGLRLTRLALESIIKFWEMADIREGLIIDQILEHTPNFQPFLQIQDFPPRLTLPSLELITITCKKEPASIIGSVGFVSSSALQDKTQLRVIRALRRWENPNKK